jgi:Asp-tRNA(Asn)/Glu-tRNA(Gln) amidotransferase A subunit family amidase
VEGPLCARRYSAQERRELVKRGTAHGQVNTKKSYGTYDKQYLVRRRRLVFIFQNCDFKLLPASQAVTSPMQEFCQKMGFDPDVNMSSNGARWFDHLAVEHKAGISMVCACLHGMLHGPLSDAVHPPPMCPDACLFMFCCRVHLGLIK